ALVPPAQVRDDRIEVARLPMPSQPALSGKGRLHRRAANLISAEQGPWPGEGDDVTAVERLVGEGMCGLVLVHGPDEEHVVSKRQVILGEPGPEVDLDEGPFGLLSAKLELAQQVAEIELDPSEVHLVEEHEEERVVEPVPIRGRALALRHSPEKAL